MKHIYSCTEGARDRRPSDCAPCSVCGLRLWCNSRGSVSTTETFEITSKNASSKMAGSRNVCALMDVPIRPDSFQMIQKLRCVFTGRNISNKLTFDRLSVERMVIFGNSLWAIEDRARVVAFDVITGERLHEITFTYGIGIGCTLFRDRVYTYTDHELFEIVDNGNGSKGLKRAALSPHGIFALIVTRTDDPEIAFVFESERGIIFRATANEGIARCKVVRGEGHFLVGAYGSHIFIYCLESNDIVDFKNDIIERRFPPYDDEMLCRFRMAPDGELYYCSWIESEDPWMIECMNAYTGNRRRFEANSNHVYFIPCAGFVPFYEV